METAANRSNTEVQSSTPTQSIKELATFVSAEYSTLPTIRKHENYPSPTGSSKNDPPNYEEAIFVHSVELKELSPVSYSGSSDVEISG